ncbi:MAG: hypothetical protein WCZ90_15555 [Melioribacteraceae bacterium]
MKILKNNSQTVLIFSAIVVLMLFFNLVLDIYPVLSFLKFMESEKYYWTIPITVLFLCGFWLFDRYMRRKIINERVEIFNATIRTVQDILQNSTSSLQLLILDMKDEGVREEIIMSAEKNIEEFKKVVSALAAIDPKTIELKELNKSLSIIKMDK